MSKNIYIIDDDQIFADSLRRKLVIKGYSNIQIFHSGKCFLENDVINADLIFLDYHLGDCTGIEILQIITNNAPTSSVIMLSSVDKENIIAEAMNFGAKKYIIKGKSTMNVDIDAAIFDFSLAEAVN